MNDEVCFLPATELAQRIRRTDLSARELMQATLAQIEHLNPRLNAIVSLYAEQALAQARAADEKQARGEALAPLHGLPVAHKDLFLTRGMRTTYGSPIYKDFIPDQNMLLVERLQAAGDLGALRLHPGRAARRGADRRPAPG
jgi:amidase